MILHSILESLSGAILITGLVIIMMMMIECLNIESRGAMLTRLSRNHIGQIVLAALLGAVPGCMGGFAVVSLYSHSLVTFGALVAMMIATMGDESFVMLAMFPDTTLWITVGLVIVAIVTGYVVDLIRTRGGKCACTPLLRSDAAACLDLHDEDCCEDPCHCPHPGHHHGGRHFGAKRILMFAGVAVFIAALAFGMLEHGHGEEEAVEGGINLLSEDWMNVMFALLSLAVLAVLIFASDHFVEGHLWGHIIRKHLPKVFAWTLGVLLLINIGMEFVDISGWVSDNLVLMVVIAALVGIIPESGPHLVFVTLFASGVIPLPVLLASCISQDGHAGLPLLAESPRSFILAKAVNVALALAAGLIALAV
ncbi:MAG: arsenic efflux protein [Bacteroidales bacterium]|nr:arsenic efflux protein [Bacteroidales bacterium]